MESHTVLLTQSDSSSLPEPHEHRLRNLMGIQIRNFTPFPVRDALTSSLAMTGPPPLDSVDDIELALSRRRSRRISTNSLGTVRNIRASMDLNHTDIQPGTRVEVSPGRPRANSRTPRISQRPQRERASSSTSIQTISKFAFIRQPASTSLEDASPPISPVITSLDSAQLQKSLEQVMSSRLVETFLSLEQWVEDDGSMSAAVINAANSPCRVDGGRAQTSVKHSSTAPSSRVTYTRSPVFRDKASPKLNTLTLNHSSRSASPTSIRSPRGKQAVTPVARTLSPRSKQPDTHRSTSTSHALPTPAPSPPPEPALEQVPFYLSAFHRPSTNPCFASLDVKHDFAPWVDLSSHRFKVSIWGRGADWGKLDDSGLKAKFPNPNSDVNSKEGAFDGDWAVLFSWDVNMDDLKPLSSDFIAQPSSLSSNTLVFRLFPNGDHYYLPGGRGPSSTLGRGGESRPPSPSAGYSDTEIDDRTLRRSRRRASLAIRTEVVNKSMRETKMKKSAGFGDLLNLVTLQSAIADTKVQLEEIIESCDHLIQENTLAHLREISQKQENLRSMGEDRRTMLSSTAIVRSRLDEWKAEIKRRRERLESAISLHKEQKRSVKALEERVEEERRRHTTILNTLSTVRTTLLQTVSFIFPIEPIEPKDLLFGILELPLPIPIGVNDPAPPLTLSSDSSYNEETMASAMGYVAQVINLLTAYLGDLLPFPVVCQGSRSLIKDPISAMMGPRMFPLYTRGVDTYRFEYGVFLLNKNIELLMSERDLRALDLRHTLPNLKNLLLTLTSGEAAVLKPRPRKKTSGSSPSASLVTETGSDLPVSRHLSPNPSPAPSDHESEGSLTQIEPTLPTTPTASKIVIELDEAAPDTAPAFMEAPQTVKKSFYSPLATFLRARYPSIRAVPSVTPPLINVKVEVETPSESTANPINATAEAEEAGDADETSTIRGSIRSKFTSFHKHGTEDDPSHSS